VGEKKKGLEVLRGMSSEEGSNPSQSINTGRKTVSQNV
jgi:hypothetical protein